MTEINVSQIDENPYQTRKNFNHIEDLAQRIKSIGLINPIVVRKVNDRFQVIGGSCRLKAYKLLKLNTIECNVKEVSDKEALRISFEDNEARQDLEPNDRAMAILGQFQLIDMAKNQALDGENGTYSMIELVISNLNTLQNKINNPRNYKDPSITHDEQQINEVCIEIKLKPSQIINILTPLKDLYPEIQDDKYNLNVSQRNSISKVNVQIQKEIERAKEIEESSGDEHHINSNKLVSDKERIEKAIIEKVKNKDYRRTDIKKISDAITKAPKDLKVKIAESPDVNINIAKTINKIDSRKDLSENDRKDIMNKMVEDHPIYDEVSIDRFIDDIKPLPLEIKEAVKKGLDINVARDICVIKDKKEREKVIDTITHEPVKKQQSIINDIVNKDYKEPINEIELDHKKRLINKSKYLRKVNKGLLKTYSDETKKDLSDEFEFLINDMIEVRKILNGDKDE